MNKLQRKLFARCWTKEYQSAVRVHEIEKQIERAEMAGKATNRLRKSLSNWQIKQEEALIPVRELIKKGVFGEDAVSLCNEIAVDIRGYVADCYYYEWLDHKPS